MQHQRLPGSNFIVIFVLSGWFWTALLPAQEPEKRGPSPATVLTRQEWKEVDQSIEKALAWLLEQQEPDGSFPTLKHGQPGVTSLCTMAFLSQGHLPGEGKYGEQLQRSLDYIVSCQRRSGVLALAAPNREKLSRIIDHETGYSLVYNHALAGLALSECYAMVGAAQTEQMKGAIEKALDVTFQMQDFRRARRIDRGGWRYLDILELTDADLSVTAWQLMFMRSAKNAGFDVDAERIDRAVEYVHRCFLKDHGTFTYKAGYKDRASRGMAGAGILALAHSGKHDTKESLLAGDWILKSGFESYNNLGKVRNMNPKGDRYFYGLLTCSHAMYQLGGRHWRDFFPPAARVLMENQNANGSWDAEERQQDARFGNAYTTAVGVLALSAPNGLLPIFQR